MLQQEHPLALADNKHFVVSLSLGNTLINLNKIKCPQCRKRFDTMEEMEQHRTKHLTENKFKCEICSKEFPSHSSMWKHTKAHTGERLKPFKCPICEKCFTQQANMLKHQLLHTGKLSKPLTIGVIIVLFASSVSHLMSDKIRHYLPISYTIFYDEYFTQRCQIVTLTTHSLVHSDVHSVRKKGSTFLRYILCVFIYLFLHFFFSLLDHLQLQDLNHTNVPCVRKHFRNMQTWSNIKCFIQVSYTVIFSNPQSLIEMRIITLYAEWNQSE
uniref:C2H2-type domain-containing protein n=1 Tax=Anopheles maculatus TaxID=74869 RepID=A0A182SEM3_9DIPT